MPGTSPGNLVAQDLKNFLGIKTLFTILVYCSGWGRRAQVPSQELPSSPFLWFSDTHMGVCPMRLCSLLSHNSRSARSRVLKSVTGRERCMWLSLFGRTETLILKCNSSPSKMWQTRLCLCLSSLAGKAFQGHMEARLRGQHTIQHGYWYMEEFLVATVLPPSQKPTPLYYSYESTAEGQEVCSPESLNSAPLASFLSRSFSKVFLRQLTT